MIRMSVPSPPLSPAEQFGWRVLLDLSRVIPAEEPTLTAKASEPRPSLDVVTVRFLDDSGSRGAQGGGVCGAIRRDFDVGEGTVAVSRETLRAVADVAGAAVEQRSAARDKHGRVPSSENPLVAAGHEREPIVSMAAAALRAAVVKAAGRRPVLTTPAWPAGRRWAVALSHDVDVVAAWPVFTALRLAELARKRLAAPAASVLASACRHMLGDPVGQGVHGVLETERTAGVRSTWFVLCGTPTFATFRRGDLTYRPESRHARTILRAVGDGGHEVGLHGSFVTMDDGATFAHQRGRLGALVGNAPAGVRQHFLRMRPGATQHAMVDAGFRYDGTFGFPDRNGFRLGVADVVPAWHASDATAMALDEVPLIWMDRAQSKYQGIEDPARWVEDALELATTCRQVEGLWVGLWHPNLTAPLGFPGAPSAYGHLVTSMLMQEPYVAPIHEIVEWRRLRRAIRWVAADDGGISIVAPPTRGFDLPVIGADGRALATLGRSDAPPRLRVPVR
jgi:hypothetical protein